MADPARLYNILSGILRLLIVREPIYTGNTLIFIMGSSMARRSIGKYVLVSLSIFFMIFIASIMVSAQSPVVVSPSISPVPSNEYTGWPLTIGGIVFDGDRRPVSGAVVKLWQNGQLVHNGYRSGNITNPVISGYYNPQVNDFGFVDFGGEYSFSGLYPGVYEITVEKG